LSVVVFGVVFAIVSVVIVIGLSMENLERRKSLQKFETFH